MAKISHFRLVHAELLQAQLSGHTHYQNVDQKMYSTLLSDNVGTTNVQSNFLIKISYL